MRVNSQLPRELLKIMVFIRGLIRILHTINNVTKIKTRERILFPVNILC